MSEIVEIVTAAMNLVSQIVAIVDDAKAGKLDPDVALGRIEGLHASLAANRAAADAIVDQRFPR